MANHVSNFLSVQQISEEGQKVWDEFVVAQLDKDPNLAKFIFKSDEDYDRNEMCERIGAKWAFSEDHHEYGVSITSAWSPVGPFAEMIAQKIGEVDPTVKLALTYEDEGFNFIGVTTYDHHGEHTDNFLEYDEYRELIVNSSEQLQEWWDADEGEWKEEHEEEARDLLWDIQWDVINDWQERNMIWDS